MSVANKSLEVSFSGTQGELQVWFNALVRVPMKEIPIELKTANDRGSGGRMRVKFPDDASVWMFSMNLYFPHRDKVPLPGIRDRETAESHMQAILKIAANHRKSTGPANAYVFCRGRSFFVSIGFEAAEGMLEFQSMRRSNSGKNFAARVRREILDLTGKNARLEL